MKQLDPVLWIKWRKSLLALQIEHKAGIMCLECEARIFPPLNTRELGLRGEMPSRQGWSELRKPTE